MSAACEVVYSFLNGSTKGCDGAAVQCVYDVVFVVCASRLNNLVLRLAHVFLDESLRAESRSLLQLRCS